MPISAPSVDPTAPSNAASARNPVTADSGDAPSAAATAISCPAFLDRQAGDLGNQYDTDAHGDERRKIASSGKSTMFDVEPTIRGRFDSARRIRARELHGAGPEFEVPWSRR